MNNKLNKIVENYKNSTMNKIRLSYNLKNYYNLNEIQRLILLSKI